MLLGIDVAKWEVDNGHPGYLLGKSYNGGRWYFYPVALAVKLPISVLILLTLTFGSMFFRRPSFGEIILLVSLVLILVGWMPSGSNMNVGIRYLLPLYPLAIILVARLWTFGKALRLFGSLLLLGLLIESFSICPRYFTFFNAFAHGRGWTIVNDSDFDWGQGLIDLKKWQDQTHAGKIELAYFGMVNPSDYGIEWRPFGHGDDEEYVGISSCFVVGMRHRVRTEDGTHWLHLPYYKALLKLEPIAKPGGTIFIYRREAFEKARGAK